MVDNNFWGMTLFIVLISFFLIRAFCYTRCYVTPEERLYYTQNNTNQKDSLNNKPVALYTIQKIKINDV